MQLALKLKIMGQIHQEMEHQPTLRVIVEESFTRLVTFKKEKDYDHFNSELLKVLPEINRYISKRLKTAVKKGKVNKNMLSPNDFSDQLFIEVYDHLEDIKNDKELYPFLFKTVDNLLEDSLIEEEFDHVFFDNIDTYSKPEWEAMEENYGRDGDGDFVMVEELDDISYNKNNYTLNQVFITDTEKELAKKLDASFNKERLERHIAFVLDKMPLPMRAVFQLYVDQGFSLEEITKIRKISVAQVEQYLANARKILRDTLYKRFLITSN